MSDLISRKAAYEVLTDYYHHKTETQHQALKEALGRVPSVKMRLIDAEALLERAVPRGMNSYNSYEYQIGWSQGYFQAMNELQENRKNRKEGDSE